MGFVAATFITDLHVVIGGNVIPGRFDPALNGVAPIFPVLLAFCGVQFVTAESTCINIICGYFNCAIKLSLITRIQVNASTEFAMNHGCCRLHKLTKYAV